MIGTFVSMFQRSNMTFSEIHYMDKITDTSAILCWVISS